MTDYDRNERENALHTADGVQAAEPRTCTNCDGPIDTRRWHPVVTTTENGVFRVYAFCDEECRDEWDHTADEP